MKIDQKERNKISDAKHKKRRRRPEKHLDGDDVPRVAAEFEHLAKRHYSTPVWTSAQAMPQKIPAAAWDQ